MDRAGPEDARRQPAPGPAAAPPRRNLRTALVLLSIALVFFLGVIANRLLNG